MLRACRGQLSSGGVSVGLVARQHQDRARAGAPAAFDFSTRYANKVRLPQVEIEVGRCFQQHSRTSRRPTRRGSIRSKAGSASSSGTSLTVASSLPSPISNAKFSAMFFSTRKQQTPSVEILGGSQTDSRVVEMAQGHPTRALFWSYLPAFSNDHPLTIILLPLTLSRYILFSAREGTYAGHKVDYCCRVLARGASAGGTTCSLPESRASSACNVPTAA